MEMPTVKNKNIEENEMGNFYKREQLIHFLRCLENEKNFKAYALFRLLAFSGIALTWFEAGASIKEVQDLWGIRIYKPQ